MSVMARRGLPYLGCIAALLTAVGGVRAVDVGGVDGGAEGAFTTPPTELCAQVSAGVDSPPESTAELQIGDPYWTWSIVWEQFEANPGTCNADGGGGGGLLSLGGDIRQANPHSPDAAYCITPCSRGTYTAYLQVTVHYPLPDGTEVTGTGFAMATIHAT